jgi:hypothetical protein
MLELWRRKYLYHVKATTGENGKGRMHCIRRFRFESGHLRDRTNNVRGIFESASSQWADCSPDWKKDFAGFQVEPHQGRYTSKDAELYGRGFTKEDFELK